MTPFGIGPRDVLTLVRHAQRVDLLGPLLVTGVLAEQLAAAIAAGFSPSTQVAASMLASSDS